MRGALVVALISMLVVSMVLGLQPAARAATAAAASTTVVFGAIAVPVGYTAVVHLSGPNGFSATYSGAGRRVIRGLPVGRYSITSTPIIASAQTGSTPAGTYYPAVPAAKSLTAGGTVRLKADFTTVVAPNVVVATTSTMVSTTIQPGTKPGTTGSVRVRGTFGVGELLVSGVTSATPDGLLVRLGRNQGTTRGVTTFAATTVPLTRVLLRGRFDQSVSGSGTLDGNSPGSLSGAVATRTPGSFTLSNPFRKTIPCSSAAVMGVEAKVQTRIAAAISARWDVSHPAKNSVSLSAQAWADGTMNVWVTGASACSGTKSKLGTPLPEGTVQVPVGPIPVVLVQTLQFAAQGNAGTAAPMSASLVSNVSTSAVMTATPSGRTSTMQAPVMTAQAGVPWATGSGAATLVVGAKLHSKVYGIDGAYASVKIGPNVTVDSSSNPWWSVAGHVTAGIGVHVASLGIRQGQPARLDRSWWIRDAGGPMAQ
jgi:hypothetical protein